MSHSTRPSHHSSSGFVMILTLILLFMLTALALTQATVNSTQTRLATNYTSSEMAFETAEGALNQAINNLMLGAYSTADFSANANGFYSYDETASPLWQTVDWSSSGAVLQSFQGSGGTSAAIIIEQLPSVVQPGQNMTTSTRVYRITARSAEPGGNAAVILQSTLQIQ